MDSGNSGSLQSSSGGEDEFDSRGGGGGGVDSSPLSALLRPSPSPSAAAFSLHGSYFGLQEFTSAPPPQQQAGAWSGASGSFAGASGLSSSSSPRVADAGAGARTQGADAAVAAAAAAQGQGGGMAGAPAPAQPPRGSRKRTRASRRAPTTVLTTDTSNFRAMVQEFTGIPSPPFGAGVGVGVGGPAASLRTRFDHIFPPPSSLRSAAAGAAADAASLPPYLLRPFPHKLPTVPSSFPPFAASSSSASSSTPSSSNMGAANANAATGAATTAATSSNPAATTGAGDAFQQLTSSALLRLQQDPSSFLSFQNLLDSHPSSQSIFGAAAGGFGQSSRMHDPAPSPSDFLTGVGSGSHSLITHGGLLGSEGLHLHHSRGDVHGHGHGGDELSGVVAAGASGGSCKLNYSSHAGAVTSSSAAGAGADKPPDGAPGRPGRGDGLDPWICTSE